MLVRERRARPSSTGSTAARAPAARLARERALSADADHRRRRHGRRPRARRDRAGAWREVSLATDIECLLVGDERRIQAVLEGVSYNPEHIAHPARARRDRHGRGPARGGARRSDDASLLVARPRRRRRARRRGGVGRQHRAPACSPARAASRCCRGIRRAALASVYPRQTEYPGQDRLALLLDVGATVRCEADELVQFALMGSAYARRISKVPSPRVGLLNMGREATKGGDVLVEAHRRLRALPSVNFVGNVEGNDLVRGRADVIVCEGLARQRRAEAASRASPRSFDDLAQRARRSSGSRGGSGCGSCRRASSACARSPTTRSTAARRSSGSSSSSSSATGARSARAIANAVKVAAKAVRDRVPAEIADARRAAAR